MFTKKTAPWWIGGGVLIVLIAVLLGTGSLQQVMDNGKSNNTRGKSKKKG